MTVADVAFQLGLSRNMVYEHLRTARRMGGEQAGEVSSLELEVVRRALVYPDRERREWIEREMKRWAGQK